MTIIAYVLLAICAASGLRVTPMAWRSLRAVADSQNLQIVDEAEWGDGREEVRVDPIFHQERLRSRFPMLAELDREMAEADYIRLPREAK